MPPEEHRLTVETQYEHWWYTGRQDIMRALIERNINLAARLDIADAGCGVGVNTGFLRQYGQVTAYDNDEYVLQFVKSQWGGALDTVKWTYPNPLPKKHDLIVMTDVLEHFEDDAGVARWLYDQLNDGGYVLLTVPANRLLWSEMDDLLGHFRRYDRQMLKKLFCPAFEAVQVSYYNCLLLPVKLLFAGFSRIKTRLLPSRPKRSYNETPSGPVNMFFRMCISSEAAMLRSFSLPWGVALVALFRKPPRR